METTDMLVAIEAIRALKARYFRTIDTKDWDGFRSVFAPDLVADFREATPEPNEAMLTHGADVYVAQLAPILADVVTVHHGHTPEITVESETSASGIWAMEDKLWTGPSSSLPFRFMHGYGHYHERYVRLPDGWRISAVRLTRLRVDMA